MNSIHRLSLTLAPHRTAPPFENLAGYDCKFPNPHFNAYIDLDGDCLADLFLVCQNGKSPDDLSYQIWLNGKDGQFKLGRKGDLPRGTKSVGFADMGEQHLRFHLATWTDSLDRSRWDDRPDHHILHDRVELRPLHRLQLADASVLRLDCPDWSLSRPRSALRCRQ
jgi:hypothetical protein